MYRFAVFCVGKDAEDCVSGELETMIPLQVGHIHRMKGRGWKCEHVEQKEERKSDIGQADFRPYKQT